MSTLAAARVLGARRADPAARDGPVPRLAAAVWLRNARVFSKLWHGALLPTFLDPLLYLLAMGFGLGTYVARINGVPYKDFIAPGLIASAAMWSASFETTYNVYIRMNEPRLYDDVLSTPVEVQDLVAGDLAWSAIRAAVYGCRRPGRRLGLRPDRAPGGRSLIPPFVVLGGLCFSVIGYTFTALIPKIDLYSYFFTLGITPMFLFSGIFFPFNQLPDWVEVVAWFTPLYHLVEITRGLATGPELGSILLQRGLARGCQRAPVHGPGAGAADEAGRLARGVPCSRKCKPPPDHAQFALVARRVGTFVAALLAAAALIALPVATAGAATGPPTLELNGPKKPALLDKMTAKGTIPGYAGEKVTITIDASGHQIETKKIAANGDGNFSFPFVIDACCNYEVRASAAGRDSPAARFTVSVPKHIGKGPITRLYNESLVDQGYYIGHMSSHFRNGSRLATLAFRKVNRMARNMSYQPSSSGSS